MKIRTQENLLDVIDQDFAWRKKELATLRFVIKRAQSNPRFLTTALRAGIALLYAHWEGFLKSSSENFLEFVSRQNLNNEDVAPNILALCTKRMMNDSLAGSKIDQAIAIVSFFRDDMSKPLSLPRRTAIPTESNLSSTVLCNISKAVGIDYSLFETKAFIIDERLLAKRNSIAHGQFFDLDLQEFEDTLNEMSQLLEVWRNEIENVCALRKYLVH
ncbi:MAG: MAE_28990/MAE_18760 family HEPN-like nuclease [Verrucomicrobiae bacterium]|nr:MAE_28990/MAE_18760 family HEPN-like nuclease [Verrucomicrobiae bacterium]